METMKQPAKVQFAGTISTTGSKYDNRIIWIPKIVHKKIAHLEGKQLMITLEEI
jgi:hypothetical protein